MKDSKIELYRREYFHVITGNLGTGIKIVKIPIGDKKDEDKRVK